MSDREKKTAELLEELLKIEDPALVGVKKILRHKKESVSDTSTYQPHTPEVFNLTTEEKSEENTSIFNDDEKQVLELQKRIIELEEAIANKEEEHQQSLKEAYEQGVEEGKRVQAEIDSAEIEERIKSINEANNNNLFELIQKDLEEREYYFSTLEEQLKEVIITIAKQVVKTEITQNQQVVASVLKRALFYVAEKNSFEIRVNPSEKDRVEELIEQFKQNGERYSSVIVIGDESISDGGVIIETPSGAIDASIESQLQEIEIEVKRMWAETTSEQE